MGSCPQADEVSALDRKGELWGLVAPHAGYVYSGRTAAAGYSVLAEDGLPETFVILGPNHTGLGAAFSVSNAKYWETPLGSVEVDRELALAIQKHFDELAFDDFADHLWRIDA